MTPDTPDLEDITTMLSKASVARAYDYMLGGKDNFEADRIFAAEVQARDPHLAVSVKLNKLFGQQAVDYIVRRNVSQFLDLGSGIPTSPPSVHETARNVNPDSTVVYVDFDPVVASQNRALNAIGPGLTVVKDSMLNVDAIFDNDQLLSTIDPSKPIGVLLLSVLQNTPYDQVLDFMQRLRSRMAPGSYLALTHISDRTEAAVQEIVAQRSEDGTYPPTWFRSDEQLAEIFAGFELAEPGLVDYRDWPGILGEAGTRPELSTPLVGALGYLPG